MRRGIVLAIAPLMALGCAATSSSSTQGAPPADVTDRVGRVVVDHVKRMPDSPRCAAEPVRSLAGTPLDSAPGGRPNDTISAVIHGHVREVQACYDSIRRSHPKSQGRIKLRFALSPSGTVGGSCVETSEFAIPEFESCVADLASGWTFPEARIWGIITYPFVFVRPPSK